MYKEGNGGGTVNIEGARITNIPFRGIRYCDELGREFGSIIIRQEHIAFIAGNWCKQVSRKSNRNELLSIAREHEKRLLAIKRG